MFYKILKIICILTIVKNIDKIDSDFGIQTAQIKREILKNNFIYLFIPIF